MASSIQTQLVFFYSISFISFLSFGFYQRIGLWQTLRFPPLLHYFCLACAHCCFISPLWVSEWVSEYDFWVSLCGFHSLLTLSKQVFHLRIHFYAPIPTPFPFAPSLPHTSVALVLLPFRLASMPANHLLSAWRCHLTPSFSSSLTSFFSFTTGGNS